MSLHNEWHGMKRIAGIEPGPQEQAADDELLKCMLYCVDGEFISLSIVEARETMESVIQVVTTKTE